MFTLYRLVEANMNSVWYFHELLPEILLGLIAVGIFAYNMGKEAGRKKAEQGFLKEFAELFAEASQNMEEYIEELANMEEDNK